MNVAFPSAVTADLPNLEANEQGLQLSEGGCKGLGKFTFAISIYFEPFFFKELKERMDKGG